MINVIKEIKEKIKMINEKPKNEETNNNIETKKIGISNINEEINLITKTDKDKK